MSKNGLGSVDLFGLDEFGQAAGGLNVVLGTATGVGLQSVGAIMWRRMSKDRPDRAKWAELVGAGVGIASGAAMMAMEDWRTAGWAAMAGAGLAGAIRHMDQSSSSGAMGLVDIERAYALQGNLGLVDIEKQYALGDSEMPTLVGNKPELVGGPAVSSLAGHFGATVFGS